MTTTGLELDEVCEDDYIHPEQLARKSSLAIGARRLAAEVLKTSVLQALKLAKQGRKGKDYHWIFNDDVRWPYSFLNLCSTLKVDPGRVRKLVNRKLAKSATACKRS